MALRGYRLIMETTNGGMDDAGFAETFTKAHNQGEKIISVYSSIRCVYAQAEYSDGRLGHLQTVAEKSCRICREAVSDCPGCEDDMQ